MMMEPPERRSAATPGTGGGGGSFSSTTYVRRRASGGGAALRRLNRASKKMALAGKRRVSSVIRIYLEWNDANKCSTSSTALLMNAHDIFESLISSLTCIYHRELSLV